MFIICLKFKVHTTYHQNIALYSILLDFIFNRILNEISCLEHE